MQIFYSIAKDQDLAIESERSINYLFGFLLT